MAGAATPQLDGVTVAILAVRSTDERLCRRRVRPGYAALARPSGAVDEPMLTWWAADDLGRHYPGQPGGWHSGADRSGGQVEFWPALDPAPPVRAGHHADHGERSGPSSGSRCRGRPPGDRAVVKGPARGRGPGGRLAGRPHRLRWAAGQLTAPEHTDLDGEQILSALAGQGFPLPGRAGIAGLGHAADLRVLVLASRGPADPVRGEAAATRQLPRPSFLAGERQ